MLDPVDLFYVLLALIVVAIVTVIARAVRLTNASLTAASRNINLTHPDVARRLVDEIRGKDVLCARCGRPMSTLLGTGNRYRCDTCQFEFEGPAHMPAEIPRDY
jgi:tRNA(Ile2) C34 agmatinyltransferase TiaS